MRVRGAVRAAGGERRRSGDTALVPGAAGDASGDSVAKGAAGSEAPEPTADSRALEGEGAAKRAAPAPVPLGPGVVKAKDEDATALAVNVLLLKSCRRPGLGFSQVLQLAATGLGDHVTCKRTKQCRALGALPCRRTLRPPPASQADEAEAKRLKEEQELRLPQREPLK